MELHRKLSKVEEPEFRQWARDNFKFFNAKNCEKHINSTWHPVVQDECRRMRQEYLFGLKLRLDGYSKDKVDEAVNKLRTNYYSVMNGTIA
jgi:hypothetical protein